LVGLEYAWAPVAGPALALATCSTHDSLTYQKVIAGKDFAKHSLENMDLPDKTPANAIAYPDPQAAVDAVLEAWLPRLIESNEVLSAALVRLRDFYLAGTPPMESGDALAQVKTALEWAAMVQKGS
jgi:hypothetical protein